MYWGAAWSFNEQLSMCFDTKDDKQDRTVDTTSGTTDVCQYPGCIEEDPLVPDQAPDISPPDFDLEELSNIAKLMDIKIAMKFIQALQQASLDGPNSHLDDDMLVCL
jgi:hypothetical protein